MVFKVGEGMWGIILISFFGLSVVASVLTVAACMLSSRLSQDAGWEESFEQTSSQAKPVRRSYPVKS